MSTMIEGQKTNVWERNRIGVERVANLHGDGDVVVTITNQSRAHENPVSGIQYGEKFKRTFVELDIESAEALIAKLQLAVAAAKG